MTSSIKCLSLGNMADVTHSKNLFPWFISSPPLTENRDMWTTLKFGPMTLQLQNTFRVWWSSYQFWHICKYSVHYHFTASMFTSCRHQTWSVSRSVSEPIVLTLSWIPVMFFQSLLYQILWKFCLQKDQEFCTLGRCQTLNIKPLSTILMT